MMDTMVGPTEIPAHERIATISRQIWADKYRLKTADGTLIDLTIEDTWRRVAHALAAVEQQPDAWEDRFSAALKDFKLLPTGRIIAGAGIERRVTLALLARSVRDAASLGLVKEGTCITCHHCGWSKCS